MTDSGLYVDLAPGNATSSTCVRSEGASERTRTKAITVQPQEPETARLEDIAEPHARGVGPRRSDRGRGVRDRRRNRREKDAGVLGQERPVLGHESWRVIDPARFLAQGGRSVAGIVRRPAPVPVPMRGGRMGHVPQWSVHRARIKEIDGFMSERWRVETEYVAKIDPSLGMLGVLPEPTTVVTKAWEQVRGRSTSVLGAARRPRHRRRADRAAGGLIGKQLGTRSPCPRPARVGGQAGDRPALGATTTRAPFRVSASSPT